jgi:hypothetical protein
MAILASAYEASVSTWIIREILDTYRMVLVIEPQASDETNFFWGDRLQKRVDGQDLVCHPGIRVQRRSGRYLVGLERVLLENSKSDWKEVLISVENGLSTINSPSTLGSTGWPR